MVFALRLLTTRSILIKTAVRSGLRRNRRHVIHGVLTTLDPYPHATPCNTGQPRERRTAYSYGICRSLQHSATTDRTLVMSRGKRIESARRLLTDSTSFSMRSPSSHRFAYLTLLRRRDPLQSGGRASPFRERIKSLVKLSGFRRGVNLWTEGKGRSRNEAHART